jgi:hypothetical protein
VIIFRSAQDKAKKIIARTCCKQMENPYAFHVWHKGPPETRLVLASGNNVIETSSLFGTLDK